MTGSPRLFLFDLVYKVAYIQDRNVRNSVCVCVCVCVILIFINNPQKILSHEYYLYLYFH